MPSVNSVDFTGPHTENPYNGLMTGKELKKLVPELIKKVGYRNALIELQTAGLSESTARMLLKSTYDPVPRSPRIIEAIEDCLAKHGIHKAA